MPCHKAHYTVSMMPIDGSSARTQHAEVLIQWLGCGHSWARSLAKHTMMCSGLAGGYSSSNKVDTPASSSVSRSRLLNVMPRSSDAPADGLGVVPSVFGVGIASALTILRCSSRRASTFHCLCIQVRDWTRDVDGELSGAVQQASLQHALSMHYPWVKKQ